MNTNYVEAKRDLKGLQLLVGAAILAVAALLVSLPLLAARVDAQSAQYEVNVASSELQEGIKRLSLRTAEGAIDDGILSHSDPVVDQKWYQENMTSIREHDVESQIVYTFDADDRAVFVRERAVPITGRREANFEQAVRPLLAHLRQLERGSEQLRRHPRSGHPPPVIAISTTIVVRNRVYDVEALLISSKAGLVAQKAARAPALFLVTDMEKCLLPPLRERFKLRDASITPAPPMAQQSSTALTNLDGRAVAFLTWTPRRQGRELVRSALPPILLVVFLLLGATLFAYRRGTRSAIALAKSEATSHHLAFHDQLTDLGNRRMLMQRLDAVLDGARFDGRLAAVLLLDLDRFKFVNDTYGHQCGDELIREVARRLKEVSQPGDLCVRLGGDEFVILATRADASEVAAIARQLLTAIKAPVCLSAAIVHTAASIGIATSAAEADANGTLRQADLALYRVKEQGRNNFCFFEIEMDQILQTRRALEADLREALAMGHLTVAYQPQMIAGELVGVEALARWNHSARGAVAPNVFIEVAEECGLIEELGIQVSRQVFEQSWRWPGLKIAINLSPVQLRAPTFLPALLCLVDDSRIDPSQFEFELTERVLMADDLQTQQSLATLRGIGFSLALDDFGIGYSSLTYLRRFPISKIKIDRSFVCDLPNDKIAGAMIRAVVRLARALNVGVLAEGVETDEQKKRLIANGCHAMQGNLTGPPVPAEGIDAIFADRQRTTLAA